jgi:hypothetical protein
MELCYSVQSNGQARKEFRTVRGLFIGWLKPGEFL